MRAGGLRLKTLAALGDAFGTSSTDAGSSPAASTNKQAPCLLKQAWVSYDDSLYWLISALRVSSFVIFSALLRYISHTPSPGRKAL